MIVNCAGVKPASPSTTVASPIESSSPLPPPPEIVIETVETFESPVPSFALKVNESGPLEPTFAVYVTWLPLGADSVPCVGPVTIE